MTSSINSGEGRLEVCVDGHWGTVCNTGNREELAAAACSQLGFPAQGITL